LDRPIVPQPKTRCNNILPRLDRDPVVPLSEGHRLAKRNHEIVAPRVGALQSTGNQNPWQVACAIFVKENVKPCSRPIVVIIFSEHIHFGDLPSLARRYDEIVSGLTIKKI